MVSPKEATFSHDSGKETFYLSAGPPTGQLLIFCHGWPAIAKTWAAQLTTFADLGYWVVAPDMPGYGRSSATKVVEDYSLENVNKSMLALLSHLGRDRAVWIGHDWGAVAVWSFIAHYPEHAIAAACLARPYRTLELGLEEALKTINRTTYPEVLYPYGQYDYQVYYEQSFEAATAWFDADIAGTVRAIYAKGSPEHMGKPGLTATVTRDGGWMGGVPRPPPTLRQIPVQALSVDEDMLRDVVRAMETTGFWTANAWYSNNARNRRYGLEKAQNDGYLRMPVLFIGAKFDPISDVENSESAKAMREYCSNLTETSVEAGHWVHLEKSQEVNDMLRLWLVQVSGPEHGAA